MFFSVGGSTAEPILCEQQLKNCGETVLKHLHQSDNCSIDLVWISETAMAELNQQFRGKPNSTNVLAFPHQLSDREQQLLPTQHLGDIAICTPVVEREAKQQGKAVVDHCTHLTIHGILHLLGYDHQTAEQAAEMEGLEIVILEKMQISNPYSLLSE